MFMLQLNHSMSAEGDIISPVFDVYIIDSALNQYLLMLGEFHMDGFQDHANLILCYLIFLISTFITQITFLNMLVAIMGDTFDRVIAQRPTFSLNNKLELMADMKSIIDILGSKKWVGVGRPQEAAVRCLYSRHRPKRPTELSPARKRRHPLFCLLSFGFSEQVDLQPQAGQATLVC